MVLDNGRACKIGRFNIISYIFSKKNEQLCKHLPPPPGLHVKCLRAAAEIFWLTVVYDLTISDQSQDLELKLSLVTWFSQTLDSNFVLLIFSSSFPQFQLENRQVVLPMVSCRTAKRIARNTCNLYKINFSQVLLDWMDTYASND